MIGLLARLRDEIGDGTPLGPVRAGVGLLLGWDSLAAADELARLGYFGATFHVSIVPAALEPSARAYGVVLAARLSAAILVVLGAWARPALAVSALMSLWLLACDRLQYQHDRYLLALFALLLSLAPCDRSWRAADTLAPRTGPFWAVRLAQLQVSLVYLASGGTKLLDPDWRSGLVLADAFARRAQEVRMGHAVQGIYLELAKPSLASGAAKLAIMTQLVICVAVWLRPTRIIALWWGVWFHLAVLFASGSGTFSVVMLVIYGLFVTPDVRARKLRFDPSRPWGKVLQTFVPALDWFGRFEVSPWEPDGRRGHSVVVLRRDGERVTGVRALAMIARCVPVLFPFWGPLALAASFTRQGDLDAGS